MHDGSIELMVHRRTLYDDSQGVGEPMNETAYGTGLVVRGRHVLILETPQLSASHHRPAAQQLFMSPLHTYALPGISYTDYSNNYHQIWSSLNESLPYNIHLLTFDQLAANVFLIRVEHYFEFNEDATYSKSTQIDLDSLFNTLGKIKDLVELTLAGNMPLSEMKRLVWQTNDHQSSNLKLTSTRPRKSPSIKKFYLCFQYFQSQTH